MTLNTFYYEDGLENIFNENGESVLDPMEGVLSDIIDPNIVLTTITSQTAYLAARLEDKEDQRDAEMQEIPAALAKSTKTTTLNSTYRKYDDLTREGFIDRMIEGPVKRGRVAAVARYLEIKPSTASRWWRQYNETEEVP
ncbi:hypothetical protein MFLAVUS_004435 [Mucor flavus]|uniref:Uncharacterized protein n=1 Tax=Mucor flavus TaxID=439312 RepID=A0ABP9YVX4_9FUNG